MAATKTSKTLYASASLAAATALTAITEWNLSTAYGGLYCIRLTNGASAPTTVPVIIVYVGEGTGIKRQIYTASGDTVNSSVTDFIVDLPPGTMFANAKVTNGATNAITVEVYGQELTTI